jgi:hypothetical protein
VAERGAGGLVTALSHLADHHPRILCGESADPYLGNTRVAAMPI